MPQYQIRNSTTGLFSHGVLTNQYWRGGTTVLKWSVHGKQWKTEKSLKNHLLKCAQQKVDMSGWEIVELFYRPTKPVDEWFDSKMLRDLLKAT